jgi:dsDNA-specific endonuclease/ATPase MutS2
MDDDAAGEEPITIPVEDSIDLHVFPPKEVPSLLEEYFSECVTTGITEVRIIHGKGQGFLREKVHAILRKSSLVRSFHMADSGGGGWGATVVVLKDAHKGSRP